MEGLFIEIGSKSIDEITLKDDCVHFLFSRLHDVLSLHHPCIGSEHGRFVFFATCRDHGQRYFCCRGRSRLGIRRPITDDELVDDVAPLGVAVALDASLPSETRFRQRDAIVRVFAESADPPRSSRVGPENPVRTVKRRTSAQLLGPSIRSATHASNVATSHRRPSLLGIVRNSSIDNFALLQTVRPEVIAPQKDETLKQFILHQMFPYYV